MKPLVLSVLVRLLSPVEVSDRVPPEILVMRSACHDWEQHLIARVGRLVASGRLAVDVSSLVMEEARARQVDCVGPRHAAAIRRFDRLDELLESYESDED